MSNFVRSIFEIFAFVDKRFYLRECIFVQRFGISSSFYNLMRRLNDSIVRK